VSFVIPQLSLDTGFGTVRTLLHFEPLLIVAVMLPGQVIVGVTISETVKLVVQILAFPDASLTAISTGLVPGPTKVPAGGYWLMRSWFAGVQLSVATISETKFGKATLHPLERFSFWAGAHVVMIGGVLSRTVIF